ncbi:hypothetical protein GX51_06611 [Blastomyces parvus]|uniref:Uncharacterized protein n=1 Tax=Blastomyces parvus TaxID=2060905 RepID=A0A2B7WPW1_9EURO|nr:hypothetical protein GX51_06611 [Blastomyces parvus]
MGISYILLGSGWGAAAGGRASEVGGLDEEKGRLGVVQAGLGSGDKPWAPVCEGAEAAAGRVAVVAIGGRDTDGDGWAAGPDYLFLPVPGQPAAAELLVTAAEPDKEAQAREYFEESRDDSKDI